MVSGCYSKSQRANERIPGAKSDSVFNGLSDDKLSEELREMSFAYMAGWNRTYEYDTPMLIDSLSKFKEFVNNHNPYQLDKKTLYGKYDETFFEQNVIYAYIKSEESISSKLRVDSIEVEDEILKLYMTHTQGGSDLMGSSVCLFGINRSKIQNVKSVQGIILK